MFSSVEIVLRKSISYEFYVRVSVVLFKMVKLDYFVVCSLTHLILDCDFLIVFFISKNKILLYSLVVCLNTLILRELVLGKHFSI